MSVTDVYQIHRVFIDPEDCGVAIPVQIAWEGPGFYAERQVGSHKDTHVAVIKVPADDIIEAQDFARRNGYGSPGTFTELPALAEHYGANEELIDEIRSQEPDEVGVLHVEDSQGNVVNVYTMPEVVKAVEYLGLAYDELEKSVTPKRGLLLAVLRTMIQDIIEGEHLQQQINSALADLFEDGMVEILFGDKDGNELEV